MRSPLPFFAALLHLVLLPTTLSGRGNHNDLCAIPETLLQDSTEAPHEPLDTLYLTDFLNWVDAYHPLVKSAKANLSKAKAALLQARGAFDPAISGNYASKNFDGTQYYRLPSWRLETQTKGPVNFSLDWNQTAGVYTNPQDKLPEEGMFAVGGMINLGNGLLTDARRTDLSMAKLGVQMGEAEAELYRNKLLAKGAKAYWSWYAAHVSLRAYENAYRSAAEVFNFTRQTFQAGDASAMDTLDARALFATYEMEYFKAKREAIVATFELSTWLWDEGENPVALKPNVVPSDKYLHTDNAIAHVVWEEHPFFKYNQAKGQQKRAKTALAAEYLRPKVGIGGAFLLPGNLNTLPTQGDLVVDNAVVKAKVSMPLFVREGRGYHKKAAIEEQQFDWERSSAELDWKRAAESAVQGLVEIERALQSATQNTTALKQLLEAEKTKFELGDSELIKLNLRTNYYLKAAVDQAKLQKELGVARAAIQELMASF